MKTLKKTTPFGVKKGRHYHLLYLNDEGGTGLSTESAGHTHEVVFQPPQPGAPDPQTGQPQPSIPGGFILMPAEDGHTHDITEYVLKDSKPVGDEEELIKDIVSLYKDSQERESEAVKEGEESWNFYRGKQWDNHTKRTLEASNRAALTINTIKKGINEISGFQRQNRTDIDFSPIEGGDQIVADALDILVKNVFEQTSFEREESKAFKDMVIAGRGFFNVYMDFGKNLEGDIRIEKFGWKDASLGPHEKEDLEDCEYLVKEKMYSKAKLKQIAPTKADKIEKDFDFYKSNKEYFRYNGDQYESPKVKSDNVMPLSVSGKAMVDIAKKEYRVLECWRRVYIKSDVIFNVAEDFYQNLAGWDKADVDAVKTLPGFKSVSKYVAKIRITKVAGNVVLSDENPADLPSDDFFLIPIYAEMYEDGFCGNVEIAKDPQIEINKRRSQIMDIGNKMVAFGWFYDGATFPNTEERERFRNHSSRPGFMQEITDLSRLPVKVEGVQFPAQLAQMMEMDMQRVTDLMNVAVTPYGANESGAALAQKQKLRLTGNEHLFDALSFAKKKLGKLIVALIQRYYTVDRMLRILDNQNVRSPIKLGEQNFSEYDRETLTNLLQNNDLTRYDVVVSESSYSPTTRLSTFVMLSDLATKGVPVPPEVLIDYMDVPQREKDRILQKMSEQADAHGKAEDAKSKAEIQKTLIAKGIIPPEIQQSLMPQGQGQGQPQPSGQMPPPQQNGFQTEGGNPLAEG